MSIINEIHELNVNAENSVQVSEKATQLELLIFYWAFIRIALKIVKVFTGAKADAKIDEIIKWGDSL